MQMSIIHGRLSTVLEEEDGIIGIHKPRDVAETFMRARAESKGAMSKLRSVFACIKKPERRVHS